jgi:hypothetical protein
MKDHHSQRLSCHPHPLPQVPLPHVATQHLADQLLLSQQGLLGTVGLPCPLPLPDLGLESDVQGQSLPFLLQAVLVLFDQRVLLDEQAYVEGLLAVTEDRAVDVCKNLDKGLALRQGYVEFLV